MTLPAPIAAAAPFRTDVNSHRRSRMLRCSSALIAVLALLAPSVSFGMTHAEAAREIALQISPDQRLPASAKPENLYGLWPAIFPGGYEGTVDISYPDREATLEHVIVALVRWAGWDTVSYDRRHVGEILKHASPEGFPYYKFSPSPRSVPYVAAAIQAGLIDQSRIASLQKPVDSAGLQDLIRTARRIVGAAASPNGIAPRLELGGLIFPTNDERLAVLTPGFSRYADLKDLPGRILDLSGPEIRLFNPGSSLGNGRQQYFPLGPLEATLVVGMKVNPSNLSHQSEALHGRIENESTTSNAVAIWGEASSQAHDARVWGGFLSVGTAADPSKDAQLVGLEVDVINEALPGVAPNASKSGIQIVGIGSQPVSDAIYIIGAGAAQWSNGLMFAPDAITPSGAYIGATATRPVARGIDFANVRFTDSALALGQWSGITFRNASGGPSAILTDDSSQLVLRAGERGLRIMDVTSSKTLMEVTPEGDLLTPFGKLSDLAHAAYPTGSRRSFWAILAALGLATLTASLVSIVALRRLRTVEALLAAHGLQAGSTHKAA